MKKILVFAGIFLAVGAALKADLYIKCKEHSAESPMDVPILRDYEQNYSAAWDRFRGSFHLVSQPPRNVTTENWIGDKVYASVTGHTRTVIDFGKNKIYIINNADKTYFEADLPLDINKLSPRKASPMAVVTKAVVHAAVQAAPNGKTKKIGRWRCTGYIGKVSTRSASVKVAIWIAKDVDASILKYLADDHPASIERLSILEENMARTVGSIGESIPAGAILAIPAFVISGAWEIFNTWDMAVKYAAKLGRLPIAWETTFNFGEHPGELPGIHMAMKVVDIALKTPPAGLYAVPSGYKKIDILPTKEATHLAK